MDEKEQSKPSSSQSPERTEGEGGKSEDDQVPLSSQEKAKATKIKSYPTFLGRHRMNAAISHLSNQINIIQVITMFVLCKYEKGCFRFLFFCTNLF